MHSYVHCSVVHRVQDMETNLVSLDGWLDKDDVAHTCYGTLPSGKKRWNPAICSNVHGSWEGRGGQTHGDGERLWWAHNAMYRWYIVSVFEFLELYTWNIYDFISQYHLNKFNIIKIKNSPCNLFFSRNRLYFFNMVDHTYFLFCILSLTLFSH